MTDAAWVALSLIHGIGGQTFRTLLVRFGSADAVLGTSQHQLRTIGGVGPKTIAAIQNINPQAVSRDIVRWQSAGILILRWEDADYPVSLLTIPTPPPTLFIKGTWPPPADSVAIVGTRTPTAAALDETMRLSADFAAAGVTINSGLARGIDTAAHHGALRITNGRTHAVLGGGLLNIYPPENSDLAEAIQHGGALISETSPDASVSRAGLVSRNRLISGLSSAVIVMQTSATGGALYAARAAAAQGRRVYYPADLTGSAETKAGIDVLRTLQARPLPEKPRDILR